MLASLVDGDWWEWLNVICNYVSVIFKNWKINTGNKELYRTLYIIYIIFVINIFIINNFLYVFYKLFYLYLILL